MDFITQHANIIGLLFFFSVFVGIACWAFLPSRKKQIESYKYIPIAEKDDE